MLTVDELKGWLHKQHSKTDKLLIVLGSFDMPSKVKEIKSRAAEAGLNITKWNVGAFLGKSKGRAISLPAGWELTEDGRDYLGKLGVFNKLPRIVQVAVDLRDELQKITSPQTREFVEEAIKCFEADLNRSAIVMSWLAAVDVLYAVVVQNHLAAFNAEATRRNNRWRTARNADDLAEMKEYEFLDCLHAISVIGKSVKEELRGCLKRRNGCGHPNSLNLKANTAAHHIEVLILNVFQKF